MVLVDVLLELFLVAGPALTGCADGKNAIREGGSASGGVPFVTAVLDVAVPQQVLMIGEHM